MTWFEKLTRPSNLCQLWSRVLLRFVQFVASLVAYVALSTSCVTYQRPPTSNSTTPAVAVVVSSRAMSFAPLINFLAFVYALAFLIFIEWLRLCGRPLRFCEQVLDFVALLFLLVCSLVLALSDPVLHCEAKYGLVLRCDALLLGVAASWASTMAFLLTVLLGLCSDENGEAEEEARRLSFEYGGRGQFYYYDSPPAQATPVVAAQSTSTYVHAPEIQEPPGTTAQPRKA